MQLQEAINEFLLGITAEGASIATVKWYKSILTSFAKTRGACELETITASLMRGYLAETRNRAPEGGSRNKQISPETLYTHHRALNSFFLWSEREYGIVNPMANIKRPRRPKGVPRGVDHADVVKMFDIADTRDKLIIAWLTDTGCRATEMCSIRVEDIDFARLQTWVVGKGSKPRMVLFSPFTADLVRVWLNERQSNSEYLLVGRLSENLTRYGVRLALKRLAKKAGVKGRFNPHAFRHGFAREYLMAGGDLATLSQILGHASASFTADQYGLFDVGGLRNLHLKHSPIQLLETKKSAQKN